MDRTALVIGGTGPTGPHVVRGLRERGFEPTILHRGIHESPDIIEFEHIHADPHFRETIEKAIGNRTFDVVLAMYGRLRHAAAACAGRCGLFVGVSGIPAYAGHANPESVWPQGVPLNASELAKTATADSGEESGEVLFASKIADTERSILAAAERGRFAATLFRYPRIYGPRQVYPHEWSVIKRVLDGRSFMILPDGGLTILTRCAAANAAGFLLAAVDRPLAASGEVFNVADSQQYTFRQWVEVVSTFAGRQLEIASLPSEVAGVNQKIFFAHPEHTLVSPAKAEKLLGYAGHVPAEEAIKDTVDWYMEHPLSSESQSRMRDQFDYIGEDKLLAEYRRAIAALQQLQGPEQVFTHSYAHPKTADEGTDHRGR
jgi:nucleoside-diphosphate-sugar epimerase